MKERPILFSGAMVRALLAGTKTQMRLAVKLDATPEPKHSRDVILRYRCPYGQPGDRLWVRETWQGPLLDDDAIENPEDIESPKYCFYAANGGPAPEYEDADGDLHCRWRPSIHMPRWASRITLEIVSVRVERLQDISEADARAEGARYRKISTGDARIGLMDWWFFGTDTAGNDIGAGLCAKDGYELFWEYINGAGSWDANPWIWVIEFKRAEGEAA